MSSYEKTISSLWDTHCTLEKRLFYLYRRTDLQRHTIRTSLDKRKVAELEYKLRLINKEISILEKNIFQLFHQTLVIENAILWIDIYKCLECSAQCMEKLQQRITSICPDKLWSDIQSTMEEYERITETMCEEDFELENPKKKEKEKEKTPEPQMRSLNNMCTEQRQEEVVLC